MQGWLAEVDHSAFQKGKKKKGSANTVFHCKMESQIQN